MALDRWVALFIFLLCAVYGYTAWFSMDQLLAPVLRNNPIWPSTFPKVLAIGGMVLALAVVLGVEKEEEPKPLEIKYKRLHDDNLVQALALLALMVVYAFALRPLGFLASTFLFLSLGSIILGERRFVMIAIIAAVAAGSVWYLVEQVLGIFLRPLPTFL